MVNNLSKIFRKSFAFMALMLMLLSLFSFSVFADEDSDSTGNTNTDSSYSTNNEGKSEEINDTSSTDSGNPDGSDTGNDNTDNYSNGSWSPFSGSWQCSNCGYYNPDFVDNCLFCSQNRYSQNTNSDTNTDTNTDANTDTTSGEVIDGGNTLDPEGSGAAADLLRNNGGRSSSQSSSTTVAAGTTTSDNSNSSDYMVIGQIQTKTNLITQYGNIIGIIMIAVGVIGLICVIVWSATTKDIKKKSDEYLYETIGAVGKENISRDPYDYGDNYDYSPQRPKTKSQMSRTRYDNNSRNEQPVRSQTNIRQSRSSSNYDTEEILKEALRNKHRK
jgi:hypothetical protein